MQRVKCFEVLLKEKAQDDRKVVREGLSEMTKYTNAIITMILYMKQK